MVLYRVKYIGHSQFLQVSCDSMFGPMYNSTVDVIMFCGYDWGRRHEAS